MMRSRRLKAALVLAGAVACLASVGCHRTKGHVPQKLLGVWTSSTPGYSDRYIEIRPDTIIFGTGGTRSRGYRILGCERQETSDGPLYVLEFSGVSGGPVRRPLYYLPEGGGKLKFKNEPAVTWVKAS